MISRRRIQPRYRTVGAAVMALTLILGLTACDSSKPRVIVYGDSLVWESQREIKAWASARGWDATVRSRFGGAPCSLFSQMRSDRGTRPAVVILSFAGNTHFMDPCIGTDTVESHRRQITEVKRIWTGSGTQVYLGVVPWLPSHPSEQVQEAMKAETYRQGMRVIDGGKYVTPNRVWSWTQPCMAGERCVGHQINPAVAPGRNIVRANDKVHFCPGPGHGWDPCSYYSSGSWRYGRALTEVLG